MSQKHEISCWKCHEMTSLETRNEFDGCCWACGEEIDLDDYLIKAMDKRDEHYAALSAVTAERDRLREEVTELDALRDKLSGLLSKTAVALRGPEPELTRYGYADIPLRVKTVVDEIDQLRAEVEALRKDAELYRQLRDLAVSQLGLPGVPCVAVPEGPKAGRYVSGPDLDAAMAAKEA